MTFLAPTGTSELTIPAGYDKVSNQLINLTFIPDRNSDTPFLNTGYANEQQAKTATIQT